MELKKNKLSLTKGDKLKRKKDNTICIFDSFYEDSDRTHYYFKHLITATKTIGGFGVGSNILERVFETTNGRDFILYNTEVVNETV